MASSSHEPAGNKEPGRDYERMMRTDSPTGPLQLITNPRDPAWCVLSMNGCTVVQVRTVTKPTAAAAIESVQRDCLNVGPWSANYWEARKTNVRVQSFERMPGADSWKSGSLPEVDSNGSAVSPGDDPPPPPNGERSRASIQEPHPQDDAKLTEVATTNSGPRQE